MNFESANKNDALKTTFTQAANSLTNFYKECLKIKSEAYLQGQIDALKDLVSFALVQTNGDIKNMPTSLMLDYISKKMQELQSTNSQISQTNNNI